MGRELPEEIVSYIQIIAWNFKRCIAGNGTGTTGIEICRVFSTGGGANLQRLFPGEIPWY